MSNSVLVMPEPKVYAPMLNPLLSFRNSGAVDEELHIWEGGLLRVEVTPNVW
jgi:hypothetical protein